MTGTDIHIPTLETERLVLRAPKPSDFPSYVAFRTSDHAKGVGGPYTEVQAYSHFCELVGHWMFRGYGRWIVADKTDDTPLGVVGIFHPADWPEPEIAWSVFENAEGKGIAFEAAQAARKYAYDVVGLNTAISFVMPENTRSMSLAKRMGASPDGDYHHPDLGPLNIWRHPAPEAQQ